MDSNVFIIHFDEKLDGLTLKESALSKAGCSGQDLALEGFHVESLTETPPIAQSHIRTTCEQRRWSREMIGEQKQRRNPVQPSPEDTSADVLVCDAVKEEISRVPVFPQPWPVFQNEPAESSNIPEGGNHNRITPKIETDFMELEVASNESNAFVSRSQASCDILEGTRYLGDAGGPSFQSTFSSTEFVGFHQPTRKPPRKHWKSYDTRVCHTCLGMPTLFRICHWCLGDVTYF